MNGLYKYFKPLLQKITEEKSKEEKMNVEFVPTNYASDLTDEEWDVIKHLFPYGNQAELHKRSLINAIFYITKTGCQWRMIPNDFPHWSAVWSFFRRTKESGIWEEMNDLLVKKTREKVGRKESPSYSLIDSQSTKTTTASEERGFDGGKKTKGRKRHIVTDTMGNLLSVVVHAANIHDTKSGILVFRKAMDKYPTIKGGMADMGYRKTFVEEVRNEFDVTIDISARIKHEFELEAKRWVVERTLSWLNNSRRLSKDYEITISSEEAFVMISHTHTLLKRLCSS